MKKQEIYKSKVYRDMEEHYKRACRELHATERALHEAQERALVLQASLEERRNAMVFLRFV